MLARPYSVCTSSDVYTYPALGEGDDSPARGGGGGSMKADGSSLTTSKFVKTLLQAHNYLYHI